MQSWHKIGVRDGKGRHRIWQTSIRNLISLALLSRVAVFVSRFIFYDWWMCSDIGSVVRYSTRCNTQRTTLDIQSGENGRHRFLLLFCWKKIFGGKMGAEGRWDEPAVLLIFLKAPQQWFPLSDGGWPPEEDCLALRDTQNTTSGALPKLCSPLLVPLGWRCRGSWQSLQSCSASSACTRRQT